MAGRAGRARGAADLRAKRCQDGRREAARGGGGFKARAAGTTSCSARWRSPSRRWGWKHAKRMHAEQSLEQLAQRAQRLQEERVALRPPSDRSSSTQLRTELCARDRSQGCARRWTGTKNACRMPSRRMRDREDAAEAAASGWPGWRRSCRRCAAAGAACPWRQRSGSGSTTQRPRQGASGCGRASASRPAGKTRWRRCCASASMPSHSSDLEQRRVVVQRAAARANHGFRSQPPERRQR